MRVSFQENKTLGITGDCRLRVWERMSPAVLKSLSLGTEVGGFTKQQDNQSLFPMVTFVIICLLQ